MMKSTPRKTPERNHEFSSNKTSTPKAGGTPKGANNSLVNPVYFCHYRNAMYMGGIKSFQKHGHGILLHDNGTSALTSYYNDALHGPNIFFQNGCLISAEYSKGKLQEVVYRTQGFLLYLNYNNDQLLDGKCLLLNYTKKSIIITIFKKGVLIDKKEQKDYTTINKAFQIGDIDSLVGKKHSRIIKYDFQKIQNISINKSGNKIIVGLTKNSLLNGLGFTFLFRGSHGGYNPDTHRHQDQFELQFVERGYYMNSQLHGLGEKWFKNGNLYIGEFKNDVFDGHGILRNALKKNWVNGNFQKGILVDLNQYSNEGQDKKCDKILESLHERKTNWINTEINITLPQKIDKQIQKILNISVTAHVKTLEQRKQEVLKKIQDNFVCSTIDQTSSPPSLSIMSSRRVTDQKDYTRKFVRNFIPDNQEYRAEEYNRTLQQKRDIDNTISKQEIGVQSSRRRSSLRKSKIFDERNNNNAKSVDSVIKLHKVLNEQKNSPGNIRRGIFKPQTSRSRRSDERSPLQSSRIQKEVYQKKPLDSKRIIGRSRIFKYLQNQPQQQPPKFTYKLANEDEFISDTSKQFKNI